MRRLTSRHIGFLLGLLGFTWMVLAPTFTPFQRAAEQVLAGAGSPLRAAALAHSMQVVAALLVLMVLWWTTEAVPLPATALLPAIVLPLFRVTGVHGGQITEFTTRHTLTHYANPIIYLLP